MNNASPASGSARLTSRAAQPGIEPLEPRIAPATFVTYTDIDGDLVKITASLPATTMSSTIRISLGASLSAATTDGYAVHVFEV